MTTTFMYKKDGEEMFIRGSGDDLRISLEDSTSFTSVTLDQVGRDALRNYLDDLEDQEEIVEQVMWEDVEF